MSGSEGNAYVFDPAAVDDDMIDDAFDDDFDCERKKYHHARRKMASKRVHRTVLHRRRRLPF